MREVFNFSAGPSMLPEEVLREVQADILSYGGSNMSVMEMSHRSKLYEEINAEAESLLRELMGISDNYDVIFVQGGASTQFEAVPLNLLKSGKADYIVTGNFAEKAYKEAQKFGDIAAAASSKDKNFTYIPKTDKNSFRNGIDYIHLTTNNTIFGSHTTMNNVPEADAPIVADASSNILGEVIDVNKFGVIYAGAQKNIGPAGVTVVIVRKDLQDKALPICPTMLKWSTQIKEKSLYNTPPCFSTYVAMLVFRWLKKLGGVGTIQKINELKARTLYDLIDNSSFYTNKTNPADRSIMNVPFQTPTPEFDAKFIEEAGKVGLKTLKGHRLVGGMRASIYNAVPLEGVQKLADFMKKFALQNK
ncbi:MAG: 3-phosphoserine/phosphohydroxythreonine transaminase [Clostridiales bacterium]|jgi:phosphoserine aminotransferase|nr:3-phosphoserine/phosphohydroxythreonine transaminase [Clostridiales bacterium]